MITLGLSLSFGVLSFSVTAAERSGQEQKNEIIALSSGVILGTAIAGPLGGIVARTTVSQTFQNSSTAWLSAVYAFLLLENAAVDHLLLKAGDRLIEGQIKPKDLAKKIYQQAKQA